MTEHENTQIYSFPNAVLFFPKNLIQFFSATIASTFEKLYLFPDFYLIPVIPIILCGISLVPGQLNTLHPLDLLQKFSLGKVSCPNFYFKSCIPGLLCSSKIVYHDSYLHRIHLNTFKQSLLLPFFPGICVAHETC